MKCRLLLFIFFCTCSLASIAQTDYTLVMDRVREEQLSSAGSITTLNSNVAATLATLKTNGSWPDIIYSNVSNYQAATHINRVKTFALGYMHPSSAYYHNDTLFDAITRSLDYWDTRDPISSNWFHNEISNPQRIGEILITLETAPLSLPSTLRSNLISQMNRGNPANQTGANKLDVATHFIYRACLTANATLMNTGVTQAFQPIVITTGEGIQPDMTFQQHGPQLYMSGYGQGFLAGEVKVATYLRGTTWALSSTKLTLLSNFVRNGFLKVLRGRYIDFSVSGRSISKVNHLSQPNTGTITKMKALDTTHAAEYDAAIARHGGSQPPSYMITPLHRHYWHSDYTVHHRPGYFFGLRNVSTRTAKSENGNKENLKGYYLSEGATSIQVNGPEYYNIFPVWDWARIPGTTVPVITTFPLRAEWGDDIDNRGKASYSGGVSDSVYGAIALAFNDYNTQARKSWFFFDNEVVCLGGNIKSTASQAINTTVNQCLLNGNVTVFEGGSQSTLATGSYTYNNTLKWASHDGVGYYFPSGGNIRLTNQAQSGTWNSINNNGGSTATQTMNVFKLWFDHGTAPTNDSYAYYVVPGQDMATYDTSQVRIQYNTSGIQAVRHVGLNVWQMMFYTAGTFTKDSVTITVDRACAIMLKGVGTTNVTMHIASPSQSSTAVKVYLDLPNIPQTRLLNCTMPSGNSAGSSVVYNVNLSTPIHGTSGSIPAIADSYVRDGATYENANFGTVTSLMVKKDGVGYTRETFFKFNVSSLPSNTQQVKLRLRVNYANTDITTVPWIAQYVSDDSWTETGITWNNMPAVTSNLDTIQALAAGNYAEWDVTDIAIAQQSADGILTLKVVSNGTGALTDANFSSRETTETDRRPSLVYTSSPPLQLRMQSAISKETIYQGTKVFPVPAGNFVRVQTDRVYNKAELRDVSGRVVKLEILDGSQQFEINLQQLPAGLYFLQLSGPERNETRKVVKK
ncbi:polysaccharide lyase family 8 super-sandwich domain-containing protein [Chitinophaga sp. MM2321]|uniref:polysaccharide lyase family 8 super-sandwich domain-containing protein n=1 Tax=Chitinophaga sp. MM2321 TaxID=3137178 RepID=UPI0032D584E9